MAMSPAEVEKFLKGMNYPARKEDLVKYVKHEMQQVVNVLQQLPDETYNRPSDVAKAFGEIASKQGTHK
jgi:hypothetical protein